MVAKQPKELGAGPTCTAMHSPWPNHTLSGPLHHWETGANNVYNNASRI